MLKMLIGFPRCSIVLCGDLEVVTIFRRVSFLSACSVRLAE